MHSYIFYLLFMCQIFLIDGSLLAPDFVKSHGYPFENHEITTSDGYILNLHRIPNNRNSSSLSSRVVVIPQCLFCNSMSFLVLGPKAGLGFLLSDAGYDVWLVNSRGSFYSQDHLNHSSKSFEYWDFTFHEKGIYDMPATMDYILNVTGVDKVDIATHSMGGTSIFIMLSKLPQYNNKIRGIAVSSPAVYLKYARAPVFALAPLNLLILKLTRKMRFYSFPIEELNLGRTARKLCIEGVHVNQFLCDQATITATGVAWEGITRALRDDILSLYPDHTSLKNLAHFAQAIGRGGFQEFDYGYYLNRRHYGTPYSPRYKLENIKVPVYLVSSSGDHVITPRDVFDLSKKLENVKEIKSMKNRLYGHNHFLWGQDSKSLVYDEMINFLKNLK